MIERLEPNPAVVEQLEKITGRVSRYFKKPVGKTLSYEQFLERPLPPHDMQYSNSVLIPISIPQEHEPFVLEHMEKAKTLLEYSDLSNCGFMFANTQMPWHTNSNLPGWRTYYIKGGGTFKYLDAEGNQQVDQDNDEGWTARRFKVTEDPLFWHAVYAKTNRFSFGFYKPF